MPKRLTMPTATLTSKGQTVIPKAIREQLGLKPGDTIDFILQENGDILIRPAAQDVRKLKGMLHRPGQKAVSIEDMNIAIKQRQRSV
jgi:antitoxin PrlF